MSHVVISSFENVATGDLQAQGEAVAVFASESAAREHFEARSAALAEAVGKARAEDADATFITWLLLLRMPLDVGSVEEALEDLELVIEETDAIDDPFGELVIAFEGAQYDASGRTTLPEAHALRELEAWLS